MPEHEENAKRAARLELLHELNKRYEPITSAEDCTGECRSCGADEVL